MDSTVLRQRPQAKSPLPAELAVGSCLGWIAQGVPIIMADDHERAGRYVGRLLFTAARRRWREARALVASVTGEAVAQ